MSKDNFPESVFSFRFSVGCRNRTQGISLHGKSFIHQIISLALNLNSDDNGLDTRRHTCSSILVTRYMALTVSVLSRDSFVNSSQAGWQPLPTVPWVNLQSSVTQHTLRRKEGLLMSTQPPPSAVSHCGCKAMPEPHERELSDERG